MSPHTPALATITTLLEQQKHALLDGDLVALGGLEERLEAALGRLSQYRPPPEDLSRVARLAAHNARLLAAARAGVAQARSRLTPAGSVPLMTYDRTGRQHRGVPLGQTLSRR